MRRLQHYSNEAYLQWVDSEHTGRRLDNYLLSILKKIPKSYVYRIIRSGEVRVDGHRVRASYRIKQGEKVRIPPMTLPRPQSRPLKITPQLKKFILAQILYEGDEFLVLNKPANYSVHAGGQCNFGLTELLRAVCHEKITPVHRLDRGTSGCLIFAKSNDALRALQAVFRRRDVCKEYQTLVLGLWKQNKQLVADPVTVRHQRQGPQVTIDYEHGQPAETRFEVIQYFKAHTLLRVRPVSGRMHQIRVHAMSQGHPIAGDRRYGDFEENRIMEKDHSLNRLFLHAQRLEFCYAGQAFLFQAEMPAELQKVLESLPSIR